MDIRQNSENPCILEKTYNGVDWIQFADLSLCVPTIRRNPFTGHYQYSPNGGIDFYNFPDGPWVDNPEEYPVLSVPPRPEDLANERICNAAMNAAAVLRQTYAAIADNLLDAVAGDIRTAAGIGEIVTGVLSILGLLGASPAIGLGSVLGVIAVAAQFTTYPLDDDDEHTIVCDLIDVATDNGSSVTFDFNGFYFGMSLTTDKATAMRAMLTSLGGDALNYAGAITYFAGEECDCTETWSMEFDFTAGTQHWRALQGDVFRANYTAGVGFTHGNNVRETQIDVCFDDPVEVTQIDVHFTNGDGVGGFQGDYGTCGSVGVGSGGGAVPLTDLGGGWWRVNPAQLPQTAEMFWVGHDRGGGTDPIRIVGVRMWGTGAKPFGDVPDV